MNFDRTNFPEHSPNTWTNTLSNTGAAALKFGKKALKYLAIGYGMLFGLMTFAGLASTIASNSVKDLDGKVRGKLEQPFRLAAGQPGTCVYKNPDIETVVTVACNALLPEARITADQGRTIIRQELERNYMDPRFQEVRDDAFNRWGYRMDFTQRAIQP